MDGVVWMHNTACMLSLYVIHFKIFFEFEIERIAPQSIEWLTEYPLSFLFFFLKFQFSKRVYLWSTTFHHIWNVCSVQCAQSTYALSSAIICPSWKWYVILNKLSSCQWQLYVTYDCKFHSQANNSAAAFHGLCSLLWICTKNAHSNVDPLIRIHWNIVNLFDVKSLESTRIQVNQPNSIDCRLNCSNVMIMNGKQHANVVFVLLLCHFILL